MAGTETNQQTGFDLDAKNQALFINESLQHLAHVLRMGKNNVPLHRIPFDHDPLTLIIKDALAGKLKINLEDSFPSSLTRIFVNISPSKFDTAVTNRSLKFAIKTGRLKTKLVDHVALKKLKIKTNERDQLFKKNNLKLLKCSPANEDVNYKLIYPETQEDINEMLHMKDR